MFDRKEDEMWSRSKSWSLRHSYGMVNLLSLSFFFFFFSWFLLVDVIRTFWTPPSFLKKHTHTYIHISIWVNVLIGNIRSSLSEDQRKNYTKAVKCLQSRPSRTPSREVPGSRSRYDDFLATHINQTLSIHGTVSHRIKNLIIFQTKPWKKAILRFWCFFTPLFPYRVVSYHGIDIF